MKIRMIAWPVVLLGVCALAGCGWERPFRTPGCAGACACNGRTVSAGRTVSTKAKRKPAGEAIVSAATMPADEEWGGLPTAPDEQAPASKSKSPTSAAMDGTPDREATSTPQEIDLLPTIPTPEGQLGALFMNDDAQPIDRPSFLPEKTVARDANSDELVNRLNKLAGKGASIVTPGQTENYQQLVGHLQQWRKTWRLRYAPVSTDDPHGGSVVLEGIADAGNLRDGQPVRVRGKLIPAETRQDSPRYVVESLVTLD